MSLNDNEFAHINLSFSFDPLGRPTVTAGSDHCFCTCRTYVCSSLLFKTKQFQAKTKFTIGETVGLAEWIIDDTCLVSFIFRPSWTCQGRERRTWRKGNFSQILNL